MECNVIFILQTICPSLVFNFKLTQLNKLKLCTCHAYTTARWHIGFCYMAT